MSTTPLAKKLGYRAGQRVRILGAPEHYPELVGPLLDEVRLMRSTRGSFDLIHAFFRREAGLRRELPVLAQRLTPQGMLWLSWPKKSSSLETDLDREVVRALGLETGLVDVKVCAVDGDWSGLKFVIRLRDRPK
tara:strand:+ start:1118 stop:1519 length:402 start_codon:yes stop_codon:yes gene_type:complete